MFCCLKGNTSFSSSFSTLILFFQRIARVEVFKVLFDFCLIFISYSGMTTTKMKIIFFLHYRAGLEEILYVLLLKN